MTELTDRLRAVGTVLCDEAADELERLRGKVEALVELSGSLAMRLGTAAPVPDVWDSPSFEHNASPTTPRE